MNQQASFLDCFYFVLLYHSQSQQLKKDTIFCPPSSPSFIYVQLIHRATLPFTFTSKKLQATQAVKIKFEIKFKNQVQKSSSWTRDFKNQVQIDRAPILNQKCILSHFYVKLTFSAEAEKNRNVNFDFFSLSMTMWKIHRQK